MSDERKERRGSALSDNDIERIGEAFDRKMQGLFEVIGYDTSSPETRMEIRKDHEFVRDARRIKGRVILTFFGGLGASAAAWVYSMLTAGKPPA